jgi:hypothetical protein
MRWLPAALLLLLQDPVELKTEWKKGDVVACTATETLRATFDVERLEGAGKLERTQRTVRAWTDTVLAVDAASRPSKVERAFTTHTREEAEGAKLAGRPVKTPLDGKTIVMMRKGADTLFEGADDIAEAELRLERLRPDPLLAALPAGAVAVGATWKPDGKAYLDDLNARKPLAKWTAAEITATLERVEKGTAVVGYAIKLRGKTDRGEAASLDATGRHSIRVADRRLLGFGLEASFVIESDGRRSCVASIVAEHAFTWNSK